MRPTTQQPLIQDPALSLNRACQDCEALERCPKHDPHGGCLSELTKASAIEAPPGLPAGPRKNPSKKGRRPALNKCPDTCPYRKVVPEQAGQEKNYPQGRCGSTGQKLREMQTCPHGILDEMDERTRGYIIERLVLYVKAQERDHLSPARETAPMSHYEPSRGIHLKMICPGCGSTEFYLAIKGLRPCAKCGREMSIEEIKTQYRERVKKIPKGADPTKVIVVEHPSGVPGAPAYVQKCCGTCGHHKGRKTFHEACPRLGELLFKGGTKSAKVLMDETASEPCPHWIEKDPRCIHCETASKCITHVPELQKCVAMTLVKRVRKPKGAS